MRTPQTLESPREVMVARCFITSGCVEFEGERPVPVTVYGGRDYTLEAQPLLWEAYKRTVVGDGHLEYRTQSCRLIKPVDAPNPVRTVVCRAADGSYLSNPPFPAARVPFWVDVMLRVEGGKVVGIRLRGSKTWPEQLDRYLAMRRTSAR